MTSGSWTGVRPSLRERFNILAPWHCWFKGREENFWKACKCFRQNEVTICYYRLRYSKWLGTRGICSSSVATPGRHQNTPAHSCKNETSWIMNILFMITSVLGAQWFTMIFAKPLTFDFVGWHGWPNEVEDTRVWMVAVMSHVYLVVISHGRFAEANIRLGPSNKTRTADRWSAMPLRIWLKPCWNLVDLKTWSLRLLYVKFLFSGTDISHWFTANIWRICHPPWLPFLLLRA